MEAYSVFGLTAIQTEILFELERRLVLNDVKSDDKKSEKKSEWLSDWNLSINSYLKNTLNINDIQIFNKCNDNELLERIKVDSENNVWKYMVLLECVLFSAYFPFKKEDAKKYKGLRSCLKMNQKVFYVDQKKIHK